MQFLRGSLDLSFHQARVRTSTHLHCFRQRPLDPRVLFFIGGLWRSFTLEGAGRSKLLHMFSSSVRRFRQRITEQIHLGNFRQRCAPACCRFVSRRGIRWTGPRRNPDHFHRDIGSFRELHRPLQTTPKTTGASTRTMNRCARTPSRVTRLGRLIRLSMCVLYAAKSIGKQKDPVQLRCKWRCGCSHVVHSCHRLFVAPVKPRTYSLLVGQVVQEQPSLS